jgi:DNA-binding Lrp family transcriptional regulator
MVSAIVMLDVEREKINEVAETLVDIDGVSEVFSIAGAHDLAVIVRVKDNDGLADVITGKMLKLEGITKSETHIAFRVYSKHDLERMFSL